MTWNLIPKSGGNSPAYSRRFFPALSRLRGSDGNACGPSNGKRPREPVLRTIGGSTRSGGFLPGGRSSRRRAVRRSPRIGPQAEARAASRLLEWVAVPYSRQNNRAIARQIRDGSWHATCGGRKRQADGSGQAAGGGELGVPVAGVLDGALLGAEVHIGEAEALGIAFGPFEIVQEAPVVISADIGAVEHGAADGVEVAAHELDAALIGNAAVFIR